MQPKRLTCCLGPTLAGLLGLLGLLLHCSAALAQAPVACPPVAQAPTAEQAEAARRGARDRGFLWRLSKADGSRDSDSERGSDSGGRSEGRSDSERASWLYGTLHVGRVEWMPPGPQVAAALDASDTLALEIDLLDPSMQQRMARVIAEQPRTPLPGELQARLTRALQAECLPPQAMAALPAELQIATLATLAGRREGFDPGYGIDLALAARGHAAGRSVVSLETPELQLKLLQADSPAEAVEFVTAALTEMETGRALSTLLRLTRLWGEGDWPAMSTYERWCGCMNTAAERAEMKRLLDDRNPALADAIDALHASGQRVFAAVGSLHMVGPAGLPALLARRGYRVERIEAVVVGDAP